MLPTALRRLAPRAAPPRHLRALLRRFTQLQHEADFRSDTVTKPTAAMTLALFDTPVGDDVYGEDPTVRKLEERVAELLGKEAAVFTPTATMANLLAVGSHCARGEEVVCGDESHLFVYEQGGASSLSACACARAPAGTGYTPCLTTTHTPSLSHITHTLPLTLFPCAPVAAPFHTLPNCERGRLPLPRLAALLEQREGGLDPHYARPGLVALENTHNRCGGTVLPAAYVDELGALCAERRTPLHCDGARLLNAAAALALAPARLVRACHSVTLCFSKGLGAPAGAALAGSRALVARARRLRKALGGGMRQVGILAAPALVGLEQHAKGLAGDNARARRIGGALAGIPGLAPQNTVDSNIVYFALVEGVVAREHGHARAVAAAAGAPAGGPEPSVLDAPSGVAVPVTAVPRDANSAQAFAALLRRVARVRVGCYGSEKLRLVTHHQVGDAAEAALVEGAAIVCRLMGKA